MIRVGLVGLGLLGRERLQALSNLRLSGHAVDVGGVLDPEVDEAALSATPFAPAACQDLDALLATEPEWVFVATPHDVAVEITQTLLEAGTRVLVEKPLGRTAAEAAALHSASRFDTQLWVGHNYRFFGGLQSLLADTRASVFGDVVSISFTLGHGGAPGMETTWKLDPERAGGGALIDPGIHLLDLVRVIDPNDVRVVAGEAWSGFWRTGVEEECHLLLRTQTIPVVNLQVSIVRWKSTFRAEVHGTKGYGIVEGRGRSYGLQRYWRGKRWGWQAAPSQGDSEETIVSSDGSDVFEKELEALLWSDDPESAGVCTALQAVENMRLLEDCRQACGLPSPATRA